MTPQQCAYFNSLFIKITFLYVYEIVLYWMHQESHKVVYLNIIFRKFTYAYFSLFTLWLFNCMQQLKFSWDILLEFKMFNFFYYIACFLVNSLNAFKNCKLTDWSLIYLLYDFVKCQLSFWGIQQEKIFSFLFGEISVNVV